MKLRITLILLVAIGNIFAQTKFEKGYFITTKGNRVDCLIKNEDWMNVPSKINYKLKKDSPLNTINRQSLNKVYIEKEMLLERHNVLIDRYSKNLKELSDSRKSTYTKENLLLKVIVDGKAKLLKYYHKGTQYFFYEINSKIEPLEYKLYKTSNATVGKNLNYQKTLRDKLSCSNKKLNSKIKYQEKALIRYFAQYNSCNKEKESVVYSKKGIFNIWGKFSIGQSISDNPFYSDKKNNQFNDKIVFKYGIELEYIFSSKNKKWSLFFEPTYQSYSSEPKSVYSGNSTYYIDYSSIEIPVGLRHYFFLNKKNKIFVNAGVNLDLVLNGEFNFDNSFSAKISNTPENYFLGLGYNFNNKLSLEFRYNSPRSIVPPLFSFNGPNNFNNASLKLGYNFL